MSNRDRPLDLPYTQVPHGLWTLDVSPRAALLLGWLHSHADDYLNRLTLNRIGTEFGGGRTSVTRLCNILADAGYLRLEAGPNGHASHVVLLSEPWETLVRRPAPNQGTPLPQSEAPPCPKSGQVPAPNQGTIEEQGEDQDKNARVDAARDLCVTMADLIEATGAKRPTVTQTWITDMERLTRLDGREVPQIVAVLRWLYTSSDEVALFWAPNVRSPGKLRARWDQIAAQVKRERQRRQPTMQERIRQATRPDLEGGEQTMTDRIREASRHAAQNDGRVTS